MRLILSAFLGAALLATPALAHDHDHDRDDGPPPVYTDGAPPPPEYGPGYGYGAPIDPRWEHRHDEWAERCQGDRPDGANDNDETPYRRGCDEPGHHPHPGGYGAYMGYAVPMMMVPVLRSKPCREVVEEIVEEVPVGRRSIRPRTRTVPDKRIPLQNKRVPMAPGKRIAY